MHNSAKLFAISSLLISQAALAGPIDDKIFFNAVKSQDLVKLQRSIPRVDVNQKDSTGKTALMTAASLGHFEAARFLLWSGADPDIVDSKNKKAVHYLKPSQQGFSALHLLLRSYSFSQTLSISNQKVKYPHMVVIDDNYTEPDHPLYVNNFYLNTKERFGKKGVDDDKNGFIDDVYGWNTTDNAPLTAPLGSLLKQPEYKKSLKSIFDTYKLQRKTYSEDRMPMKHTFNNPLSTYAGFDFLKSGDIELNDLTFYKMASKASHGTHVAGIVHNSSGKQALLHALSWSAKKKPKFQLSSSMLWLRGKARTSNSFQDFYKAAREQMLSEAAASGKRTSKYLKQLGAGVMNMSYSKNRKFYEDRSKELIKIYREHGKNPGTIATFKPTSGRPRAARCPLRGFRHRLR